MTGEQALDAVAPWFLASAMLFCSGVIVLLTVAALFRVLSWFLPAKDRP